jgi:hypothetical protein
LPVTDLIRQVGISEQTFYRWKKQYSGLESTQVRELKQLSETNARSGPPNPSASALLGTNIQTGSPNRRRPTGAPRCAPLVPSKFVCRAIALTLKIQPNPRRARFSRCIDAHRHSTLSAGRHPAINASSSSPVRAFHQLSSRKMTGNGIKYFPRLSSASTQTMAPSSGVVVLFHSVPGITNIPAWH